jgi:nicotinamide riboside kinase
LIKVAVTGPESTGKTTLSLELAGYYNAAFVPEFAREYLEKLDRPYTYEDVEKIAIRQVSLEDEMILSTEKLLVCDSELIVIKIWMEFKYKKVPSWIIQEISRRHYDIILLCNTDIPWEPDPLREHPELRRYFFILFIKSIE